MPILNRDLINQLSRSSIKIENLYASGFILNKDGYIVTCRHILPRDRVTSEQLDEIIQSISVQLFEFDENIDVKKQKLKLLVNIKR